MLIKLHIVCDRCNQVVKHAAKDCGGYTAGYYEVADGFWHKFAKEGEVRLCDRCMWSDPKYRELFR